MPRRTTPATKPSPLKKGIKSVNEALENFGQQGRNIQSTLVEGVRKIKRSVGR
jgi:hypothetical protein